MKRIKPMSAELQQMLDRPRRDVSKETSRRQFYLGKAADRLLAKSGFFETVEPTSEEMVDGIHHDCIGVHGLRPKWHGRA